MSSIVLLGPVGAGKTTAAPKFIRLMPEPVAYIEGDVLVVFHGRRAQAEPEELRTIMASRLAAAVPYAMAGSSVIVDFSIPPWYLDTARAIAKMRNIPLDWVVLKPALDICAARSAARSEGAIPDYESLRGLYDDFTADRRTIRNDTAEPAAVAAEIAEGFKDGRFRLS